VEGWCTDRGALATWNVGREGINQNKPDVFIDTDVALMTCAFHPEQPVCCVHTRVQYIVHTSVGALILKKLPWIPSFEADFFLFLPFVRSQALIAGGTFNGDLYVWDLSLEGDMQRGRSDALCDLRHQEPILSIVWQYSITEAAKYQARYTCCYRSCITEAAKYQARYTCLLARNMLLV